MWLQLLKLIRLEGGVESEGFIGERVEDQVHGLMVLFIGRVTLCGREFLSGMAEKVCGC